MLVFKWLLIEMVVDRGFMMILAIEVGIVFCVFGAIYILRSGKKKDEVISVFDFEQKSNTTFIRFHVEKALKIYTRLAETIPAFNLYVGVQDQLRQVLVAIKENEGDLESDEYISLEDRLIKDLLESPLVDARDFGNELSIIKKSFEEETVKIVH